MQISIQFWLFLLHNVFSNNFYVKTMSWKKRKYQHDLFSIMQSFEGLKFKRFKYSELLHEVQHLNVRNTPEPTYLLLSGATFILTDWNTGNSSAKCHNKRDNHFARWMRLSEIKSKRMCKFVIDKMHTSVYKMTNLML